MTECTGIIYPPPTKVSRNICGTSALSARFNVPNEVMLSRLALPVCLALLSACSTTNQVLDNEPVMVETSLQPIAKLQECISLALSMITPPHVIPADGKTVLSFTSNGTAVASVTLIPGDPNTIEVRQGFALNKKFRDRIRRCAATGRWKPTELTT